MKIRTIKYPYPTSAAQSIEAQKLKTQITTYAGFSLFMQG
jgi:hypothetical protein